MDSSKELREFVSRTGIPVAQTLMGLGTFPASDPLALQVYHYHPPPSDREHITGRGACITYGLPRQGLEAGRRG